LRQPMPKHRHHDTAPEGATLQRQERLVRALLDPGCYPHPVAAVTVVETHISWILLAGDFAYKLKKAVDFGFLDFSSLEKRRFYCDEELRLNRRFSRDLYLEVLPITGTPEQPRLRGAGAVLEYAVRMRRFSQSGLLSHIADNHGLTAAHVDEIVTLVVDMHTRAGCTPPEPEAGSPGDIRHWVDENFVQIRQSLADPQESAPLEPLEDWCGRAFAVLGAWFTERRRQGRVRECHGDLHLGNLALVDGRITPFDCIEFNPRLRWIDVISEVAFLIMDIQERGFPGLAFRFLNGYLQQSGDYEGLRVLPWYLVYRAMVRAKVAALRHVQAGDPASRSEFEDYLALATRYSQLRHRAVIVTHGVSGSGKSWWSERLSEYLGAVWARSDVERKRLYGYHPDAATGSGVGAGIYTAEAGVRTYTRLEDIARLAIDAGFPVIIDAAFLQRVQRDRFHEIAVQLGVPAVLMHCEAQDAVLQARLLERHGNGRDPSEAGIAVLESQLHTQEALQPSEAAGWCVVNTSGDPPIEEIAGQIMELCDRV